MYLYGASGHAKVIIDILKANHIEIEGLVDDNPNINELLGYPVFHGREDISPLIISIGDNKIRQMIAHKLNVEFGTAIHPSAMISPYAIVREGSVIMQGAVVQSCACIGKHCIVNTGVSVDHECVIGDYVHISPHSTLCGNVHVGEGCWIGAGTTVLPGVKVGKWSVIGAGSVVAKDIPDGVLAVGNRCKTIKTLNIEVLTSVNVGGVNYLLKPLLAARTALERHDLRGNINILITSAGKRVTLTKLFQETLRRFYPEAKVFTTDMNPEMTPAGIVSDGCIAVPRVTDPGYIKMLLTICKEKGIRIIVPTIDTELLVLAENKKLLWENGVEPMVSELPFIQACRDKRNTGTFLNSHDIRVPAPVDKYHPTFPLFAKPYDGSLSKDLYVVRCKEELSPEILNHPKLIFMEYIDKQEYKEFTVDMYYGRDNRVKAIVPRERIEIRAGEINKGFTRKNYLVQFLKERLDYLPGVVGCICIQLFYRKSDDDVVGIEINPRFGGGYPLSYYAGANFPEYVVREYMLDETLTYMDTWADNTLMLRYDNEVIVYEK